MYEWQAIYNDDTHLMQYIDGKENLFKDIDQEKLVSFVLHESRKTISVDLEQGIFRIDGTVFEVPGLSYKEGYRLIYFRRNRRTMTTSGVNTGHEVENFIGYQLDVDGKNKQVMLSEKDNVFRIHMK